jgi:alpha-beta hydrolase superfamily lysophospholipase
MASLVQDVWVGTKPRLRARRLAPYAPAGVRLIFHPDLGTTLDDPPLAAFLETLAESVEVLAYEPRGQGGSAGRLGGEALSDLQWILTDLVGKLGAVPRVVVAGHGFGAWLALAAADGAAPVDAVVALAPSLRADFRPSAALVDRLRPALTAPRAGRVLLVEGAEQEPRDREAVAAWRAAQREADLVTVPGGRAAPLLPPWPAVIAAWSLGPPVSR